MSPSAAEEGAFFTSPDLNNSTDHTSDATEPNHESPARTVRIAENEQPVQSATHKEDPATIAASEELKHTTISDKATVPRVPESAVQPAGGGEAVAEMATASPPELEPTEARYEKMKDRLSSPKKKRGRDQVEDAKELGDDNVDEAGSSADGSLVNGSRTTRSGPEKKRHRDTSEELPKAAEIATGEAPEMVPTDSKTGDQTTNATSREDSPSTPSSGPPKTSAAAFAGSGFASLAASTSSPFGSIGASKPSIFSSGVQPATSGFGALATAKPPSPTSMSTTSGFGLASGEKTATGFGFGSGVSAGFGGLASGSVFGSKLGNGFAGGPGTKLSSFAAPIGNENTTLLSTKPAKAFGAPESDEDAGSDADDSEGGAASDDESGHVPADDKKKSRPSRVADGEAGEATLLQLRAKLFAIESKEAGWKERGVGTLKINVPKSCVSYDDYGVPKPGSFDMSGLEDDDDAGSGGPRVARLIMRQENTHRVVLNTAIVRAMEFKDKPSNSTAQIIFTAFEGDKEPKPVNMLLKMSEANARIFRAELESVQRKL
ncbi:hypothetical protein QTJ16_001325 [Diplocarpon rosae]|uniref:RanBD1 domain-containing protein n=1 Tax=Diplocarpon rosae TaxID=946125 RepID=A0AAD9T6Y2_9HELO|nr:hypothetical protein QTJ16_001325 [Diplocarpon rosae]PBP28933.1 dead deah box DNA helicase [Diplocarpon rosae]